MGVPASRQNFGGLMQNPNVNCQPMLVLACACQGQVSDFQAEVLELQFTAVAVRFGYDAEFLERFLTEVELDNQYAASRERLQRVY